jgi:hypothetical protein
MRNDSRPAVTGCRLNGEIVAIRKKSLNDSEAGPRTPVC